MATLDSLPDLLFELDDDGRFLYCHAPRGSLLADPADFLGQGIDQVLPASAAASCLRALDQAREHGFASGIQYLLDMPDGERCFELSIKRQAGPTDRPCYTALARDVTERHRADLALKESQRGVQSLVTLLQLIIDNVTDMVWAKDLQDRFIFANQATCKQLLGAVDTTEVAGKDQSFFTQRACEDHRHDPNWHTFGVQSTASDAATLQAGKPLQFEESGYLWGRFVVLQVHKAPLLDAAGAVIGVVGSARDITCQIEEQEKLRLAALVLENSSEAMVVTDAANRIVDINPAFTSMTGYSRSEVQGQDPRVLKSGRQDQSFYLGMWEALKATGQWRGELWNKRKNGEVYAQWLTINTAYHDDGSVYRRVALFSDITEKKQAEDLIWRQANFDQLTHLPNRRLFDDRLRQELLKGQRTRRKVALLFLDLDRFKEVNDSLGHEAGDLLLKEAAQRITLQVRATDTVARLAGDEFAVILPDLEDFARIEIIAEGVVRTLAEPFALGTHLVTVSVSAGIAVYPDDTTSVDGLLQHADQAMYQAKRLGRNRFSFFTQTRQLQALENQSLIHDLRQAMENGELQLFFQPVVALKTGELHKVEALLRWFSPTRGTVSPADFIPLAEEYGMIHEVGDWVIGQAVLQAQSWSKHLGYDFKIALNVSPMQLMQANIHKIRWQEHLDMGGISGAQFVIEISENMLHHPSQAVSAQIQKFRDAGTLVAVDNFGAGYASFAEMRRQKIEFFKIECDTISRITQDSDELALAQAVVVIAHQLGLQVIAEGVETPEQHRLLLDMGCDFAQGYLYARPSSAIEVELMFAQDQRLNLPP